MSEVPLYWDPCSWQLARALAGRGLGVWRGGQRGSALPEHDTQALFPVERLGTTAKEWFSNGAMDSRLLPRKSGTWFTRDCNKEGINEDNDDPQTRPVHQIMSMIKWIRTSGWSIKNSLSPCRRGPRRCIWRRSTARQPLTP